MSDEEPRRYKNESPPTNCAQGYNCYHPHCLCPREDEGENEGGNMSEREEWTDKEVWMDGFACGQAAGEEDVDPEDAWTDEMAYRAEDARLLGEEGEE